MISRDTIENIINTARIEEVVGDFVSLRRRGVNMLGLCPFHNEKTPSFTVSPVKGIYKCFGCGKAGNAVGFIMEHEHCSYPEALRYLARKYNLEIEEEEQTPEQIQEAGEKESLYNLNQFAQQYFSRILWESEEGKSVGLSYLKERGIREDIIKKFQLGFSPGEWNAFSDFALRNGYKKEFLLKTGLSLEKEDHLYDRFHSRVIFPIHAASGRVIGFGGRILSSDKNRPKYVNSPESEIYNKSHTLYGIFLTKNAIASLDNCLLVEGYTDVISLYQAGIENVVASSGTSLTQDQIRMIRRYTSNITILYDGDPAGIKASFRGIDMILEQGLNVRIVLFPDGEDPDSFARNHHPEEVRQFIASEAVNFILFKTRLGLDETGKDPIRRATLIKDIVATIALIPDVITRSVYIRECAVLMEVTEQVLVNAMNKILRKKFEKTESPGAADLITEEIPSADLPLQGEQDTTSDELQERELIRLLLLYGTDTVSLKTNPGTKEESQIQVMVADYLIHDLQGEALVFEDPLFQKIVSEYSLMLEQDRSPGLNYFLSHPEKSISVATVDIVFTPYELSENWKKNNIHIETEEENLLEHLNHALLSFKARKIEKMMTELQKKFIRDLSAGEEEEILKQLKDLKSRSVLINKQGLGRVITR